MARPRSFEEEEVLAAATEAFRAHGYESTSMVDLVEATGLQKGSLYQAFGDKHALFVRVLRRYLDGSYGQGCQLLAPGDDPRDGVERWLRAALAPGGSTAGRQAGCLGVNTLVELAPHDDEVKEVLSRHFERLTARLAGAIEAGQRAGRFREDRPAGELAELLLTLVVGTGARLRAGAVDGEALVEHGMAALR